MRKFQLVVGVAALAMTTPALSGPGGDKGGKGGANKGGQSLKADRSPGNGGSRDHQQMRVDRGNGGHALRPSGNARGNDRTHRVGDAGKVEKLRGNDRKAVARHNDRNESDIRDFDRHDGGRVVAAHMGDGFDRDRGFNGCPPGLDKKNNGCLPPGQARKFLGARIQSSFADSLIPYQYRSWYRDDDRHFYRAGDGFIYRVSRNNDLVDGIIPLFGGGGYYARGDQWPDTYDFYNVPYQYRNYYADGGDYRYRYGDGAIYRVNSGSGVVDSIVALLAGDLGVGSRLPAGYDAYNVPFAYRDRYADSDDNWYRYNDGYIYQVDPKTRLISAVIDAIV